MTRPLHLIAWPAALLAAAYIITGHFWIAFDIALTVASFALALALVDALDQIDAQNVEAERVERETEAEMQRLHQELAEAQIAGGVVLPFPSIPKQRLPIADGVFPVHTIVDGDEIEALMRATEEPR